MRSALLLTLLLALGAAALRDLPPSQDTKYFVQFAGSILEACQRAGLTVTAEAIKAAGLVEQYSSPLQAITFFALDDEAWVDLAAAVRPGKTPAEMMRERGLVQQILQAHQVDFPFWTSYWPPAPERRSLESMLQGRTLALRLDAGGQLRVDGFHKSDQLALSRSDLRAGASVVHVLSLEQGWRGPQG